MKYLHPTHFQLEMNSVWRFPERGDWATHSGEYRGNWSPYVPRNLIERYSQKGDVVLDPFVGSGTTLVEAKLLHRHGIGVDINPDSIQIATRKLKFQSNTETTQRLIIGDAKNLIEISPQSVDFIVAHPPYANIIKYSDYIDGDISRFDVAEYYESMQEVSLELMRVLKRDKFCAVMVADIRRRGYIEPLGFEVMRRFQQSGFKLKEIIIKEQFNCRGTAEWKARKSPHFLLIAHEYLFIFQN